MTSIYALIKENLVFYIGKTIDLKTRSRKHKLNYGNDIEILVLDKTNDFDYKFWEKYYISLFRSWGFKLKNQNDGGGGSIKFNTLQKNKISLAKMGKSSGHKSRNKGRIVTEEENRKRSLALKGIKRSKEVKEYMSLVRKQKKLKNKSILQYDIQGNFIKEWESITYAINKTKIYGIGNVLTKRAKTAGGYIWKYKTK